MARERVTTADRALAALAARQHGLVTLAQLRELGLGRGAIEHRVRIGRLHRVRRGVHAVGHPLLTSRGRWLAAVLTAGPGAALSHRTAAALWGIRPSQAASIDVSVPTRGGRRRRGDLRIHRAPSLRPAETTIVEGIPVTTVARTLLDLAEVVPRRQLERALDEAEVLRLFDGAALAAVLAAHPARTGAARLRRVLAGHDPGSTLTRSELEERFLALCRRHGLPQPEVNVRCGDATVDFLWRRQGLVAETDGHRFHRTRAAVERDRRRDARLSAAGLRVLRFTYRQVTAEPAAVIAALRGQLGRSST